MTKRLVHTHVVTHFDHYSKWLISGLEMVAIVGAILLSAIVSSGRCGP